MWWRELYHSDVVLCPMLSQFSSSIIPCRGLCGEQIRMVLVMLVLCFVGVCQWSCFLSYLWWVLWWVSLGGPCFVRVSCGVLYFYFCIKSNAELVCVWLLCSPMLQRSWPLFLISQRLPDDWFVTFSALANADKFFPLCNKYLCAMNGWNEVGSCCNVFFFNNQSDGVRREQKSSPQSQLPWAAMFVQKV